LPVPQQWLRWVLVPWPRRPVALPQYRVLQLVAGVPLVAARRAVLLVSAVWVRPEKPGVARCRRHQARRLDPRRTAGQGNRVPRAVGPQTVRCRSAGEVAPPMEVAGMNQPATARPAQVATGPHILRLHRFGLHYRLLAAITWPALDLKASDLHQVSQQPRFQQGPARQTERESARHRQIRESTRPTIRGRSLLSLPAAVRKRLPAAVRSPMFSRSAQLRLEIHVRRPRGDLHLARGERRRLFPVRQTG
jgi:hypothetical protein